MAQGWVCNAKKQLEELKLEHISQSSQGVGSEGSSITKKVKVGSLGRHAVIEKFEKVVLGLETKGWSWVTSLLISPRSWMSG